MTRAFPIRAFPTRAILRVPIRLRCSAAALAVMLSTGCALQQAHTPDPDLQLLLPADAILLGEQHDAPEHQAVHARTVQALATQGRLVALALEMADQGRSTQGLAPDADAASVRAALHWNDEAWPWAAYGPAVMAAVRAGVPVLGANLPRAALRQAMQDAELDKRLPPDALQAQRDAIRAGHCDLLPDAQIAPMARIQIARDQAMARTLQDSAQPGGVVLLLAGSGHVDRAVGVPRHLATTFQARAVRLLADGAPDARSTAAGFDAVWLTAPVPAKDHCAELRRQLAR